jgi:GNAT superfamily N-acetyltransferase
LNPIDAKELFETFVLETRRQSYPGIVVESFPQFLRHTPEQGDGDAMVTFANLPPGREDGMIDEQIAHFARLGRRFEWKLYSFDQPSDLRSRLERRGFVSDPIEIFMVFPLERKLPFAERVTGVELRRILDDSGVRDLVAIQERLHDRSFNWWGEQLLAKLAHAPATISLYGAYADGKAVGAGRTDYPEKGQFAGIYGGSVLPGYRGRGIYSALLRQRVLEARERGYRYLFVDSAPMSRPILEKKGFIPICETRPMRLPTASRATK